MNGKEIRERLSKVVKETLSSSDIHAEANVTGTGASFTPGEGAQYATPAAFMVNKAGKNRATKFLEKLGFKTVERPKRPSSTKTADFV